MNATCQTSLLATSTDVDHLIAESGDFQGSKLDLMSLEDYAGKYWTRKQLWTALEGNNKAWFDYRMVHPVKRVCYFSSEYAKAKRRAWKKYYGKTEIVLPISPYTPRSKKNGNCAMLINTMSIVDQMGIPYATFFDEVNEHLLQEEGYTKIWDTTGWERHSKLPMLSHMRHARAVMAAQEAFDQRLYLRLVLPKHPVYKMQSWAGLPYQTECVRWLIGQSKRRGRDMPYALNQMMKRDMINEREILRYLGPEMVKTIRDIV